MGSYTQIFREPVRIEEKSSASLFSVRTREPVPKALKGGLDMHGDMSYSTEDFADVLRLAAHGLLKTCSESAWSKAGGKWWMRELPTWGMK